MESRYDFVVPLHDSLQVTSPLNYQNTQNTLDGVWKAVRRINIQDLGSVGVNLNFRVLGN